MTIRLHFHFSLSCIGEGKTTHSSVLTWRIPGTEEPNGLLSMGSHRVGHNSRDLTAAAVVHYIDSLLKLFYWLKLTDLLLLHWMVCLGNEQRSFCRFWDCIQVLHFRLFCWPWWPLHFFWGIPARSSRYNGHLS